jgi:hypothetical protein
MLLQKQVTARPAMLVDTFFRCVHFDAERLHKSERFCSMGAFFVVFFVVTRFFFIAAAAAAAAAAAE